MEKVRVRTKQWPYQALAAPFCQQMLTQQDTHSNHQLEQPGLWPHPPDMLFLTPPPEGGLTVLTRPAPFVWGPGKSQTTTVISPGSCFSSFKGPAPWKATLWAICSQLLLRELGLPSGLGHSGAVGPHQTGWSEGKALSQVVGFWGFMPQSHLCSHPDGMQIRKEGALGVCPTAFRPSYTPPFHNHSFLA